MDNLAKMLQSVPKIDGLFWEQVINTLLEGVVLISPDRKVMYVNKAAEELIGASQEEVKGRECVKAVNCPHCHCVCRLFEEGEFRNLEVVIYNQRDDTKRVVLKNGRVLRDASGEVILGVETLKDITGEVQERREKERRIELLFREKTRTEALVNNLTEGVFSIDKELRIHDYSKRMAQITGYEADKASGKNILQLLGLEQEIPKPHRLDLLAGRTFRTRIRTMDGHHKPVEVRFQPIRFTKDEIIGLVCDRKPIESSKWRREYDAFDFHGIISGSERMRQVFRLIESVADSDVSVLIEGESGTGKELVAQSLHRGQARSHLPFYALNCATFTGDLLLSELFGHEKGAFTGAVKKKKGRLEMAGEGTLLLDEVSEIPLQHQALLLRVLEERSFERVGGQEPIEMKARIVAATNVNLVDAVRAGRFREDLFYRIKVVPIFIPPLRERGSDVELLARYFLARMAAPQGEAPKTLTDEVIDAFRSYGWPGNVRELRNICEYLHLVGGNPIKVDDLPSEFHQGICDVSCLPRRPVSLFPVPQERPVQETQETVELSERDRILRALDEARYRRGEAAKLLGMDRSSLWRKMKKYKIRLE